MTTMLEELVSMQPFPILENHYLIRAIACIILSPYVDTRANNYTGLDKMTLPKQNANFASPKKNIFLAFCVSHVLSKYTPTLVMTLASQRNLALVRF